MLIAAGERDLETLDPASLVRFIRARPSSPGVGSMPRIDRKRASWHIAPAVAAGEQTHQL
jgi:hypothetical protein